MKKWAVALALIASMTLLVGAHRPPVGVGNGVGVTVQVGRAGSGIGGAAAGWDTVTLVFTTKAATPAQYPASATALDSAYVQAFDAAVAAADTVHLMGTGQEVAAFAWGSITEADTNGYYNNQYSAMNGSVRVLVGGVSHLDQRTQTVANNRYMPLTYIPFEKYIPGRATIVDATMMTSNYNNAQYTYGDTIVSVLLDRPGDDEWYKVKAGLANSPNYATASWLRQNDTNGGAWAGTQQNAWSPALDDRTFYWDMGGVSHWTGTRQAPSVTAIGAGIGIGLTNIVQNVVNGAVNNGIATYQMDSSTSTNGWGYLGWDAYSTAVGRQPYVVVKYITKKYISPYPGGAEWAFIPTTDDFQPANLVYEDTLAAHGGKLTMYGAGVQVGALGRLTMAQILALHAGGNTEIGPHSYRHNTPDGLLYWQPADTSAAEMDSLYRDARSSWLNNMAYAVDGDYRYDDPYFAKSFALPQNTWGPEVLLAIANAGYLTMRTGDTVFSPSLGKYYDLPNQGTARTDSLMSGAPWHMQREPRNMLGMPVTIPVQNIVGVKGNATADLDSIKHSMRKLAHQVIGQGRGELVLFWHDFKTDPNEAGYTEGVDGDDLGAMLDVVDELGGAYMRASELGRWRRMGGQAIDTPPAYAQQDTFRFEAVDKIWYLPDGIDNRHIRGIRDKALALSYDDTPPAPPSGLTATGYDDYVLLEWDASPAKETVTYSVHRYFDGSPDTVVVASKVGDTYYLASAVNGTEHFYFVSAVDNSDNESYDSSPASAVPSGTLALQYPAYFAMYYHDPAASAASSAQLDSLGEFDAVVFGPHAFEGDANEPFYEGMSAALKSRNTNIVLLNYTMAMTPRDDWGTDYPAGSPQKRSWDYIASIADSAGFGKNVAGYVTTSDAYPTKFVNVMLPATADTMARYFVDGLEDAGTDGTYSGFFIDLADSALYGWICYDGGCDDAMDYDQDGTEFSADAQEQAAYKAFQLEFVKGLRRELAEHGMGDRLIVGNGDFPRTNAQYAKYFDGFMWEGWNQYTPGPQGTEAAWEAAADAASLLVNAQTSPPLVLWHAKVDSSSAFITEPIAVGTNGFAHVANAGDTNGSDAIPAMVRRLPNPGAMTTANDFSADTLRVSMASYDMFLDLNHAAADTYGVWPYLVIDGADTLSVGGGWLRYIAPPGGFEGNEVEDGDNQLYWEASDRAVSYNIYRGALGATTLYDAGITNTTYSDASTPHDSSAIYYAVAAVDSAGNVSPKTYELGLNSTVYVTPQILSFDILGLNPSQGPGDDEIIQFYVDWSANKDVGVKLRWWANNDAEPDTSAGTWQDGPWLDAGEPQFDTDVVWPSSDADSTFTVEWNRDTPIPTSGYRIDGQRNNGSWITLADTLVLGPTDSTLVVDADSGPGSLELRGKWLVRAYGVSVDTLSPVAVADSALYNDAAEVHGKLKIWDGTTYVISAEENGIVINYSGMGADETAPDTVGTFVSASIDTTDRTAATTGVIMRLTLDAAEAVRSDFQWKALYDGTWSAADDYDPAAATAVEYTDTIRTLMSTDDFFAAADTTGGAGVYYRYRLRDAALNVSPYVRVTGGSDEALVFPRAAEAAGDTVLYVFSRGIRSSDGIFTVTYNDYGVDSLCTFTPTSGVDIELSHYPRFIDSATSINSTSLVSNARSTVFSDAANTFRAYGLTSVSWPVTVDANATTLGLLDMECASTLSGKTVIYSELCFMAGGIGWDANAILYVSGVTAAGYDAWVQDEATWDEYSTGNAWSPTWQSHTAWTDFGTAPEDTTNDATVDASVRLWINATSASQAWAGGAAEGGFLFRVADPAGNDDVRLHDNSSSIVAYRPYLWVLVTE